MANVIQQLNKLANLKIEKCSVRLMIFCYNKARKVFAGERICRFYLLPGNLARTLNIRAGFWLLGLVMERQRRNIPAR